MRTQPLGAEARTQKSMMRTIGQVCGHVILRGGAVRDAALVMIQTDTGPDSVEGCCVHCHRLLRCLCWCRYLAQLEGDFRAPSELLGSTSGRSRLVAATSRGTSKTPGPPTSALGTPTCSYSYEYVRFFTIDGVMRRKVVVGSTYRPCNSILLLLARYVKARTQL